MKSIIFIAPPAAGKGTQSEWLKEKYNYEHISTGDLLREAIAEGTELGKRIDALIAGGNYVDDETMIALIKEKLSNNSNRPFILDGFPRTMNQVMALESLLDELKISKPISIYLNIDSAEAEKRALGRIYCPKCKKGYNIYYEALKPKIDNICDICGEKLLRRSDDNSESFKQRYITYIDNTLPIISYYKSQGILKEILVNKEASEIFKEIEQILSEE